MSSPSSQALAPYPSPQVNPVLLMEHLLSVTKGSDTAIQQEVLKTSQAVSGFIEQMTEQFHMMAQRIAELEAAALIAEKQSQEAPKIHEAQKEAIKGLEKTMNEAFTAFSQRVSLLESQLRNHKHQYLLYYNHGNFVIASPSSGTFSISYNTTSPHSF